MASQQWKTYSGKKTVRVKTFPTLSWVSAKDQDILLTMVKNVVATRGRMTWDSDGKMLNIETYTAWKDFAADFMQNSKEIADYFSAPNLFATQIVSERITIVYR